MADEELAIAPSGLETAPAPEAIETNPAPAADEPAKVDDLDLEATETEAAPVVEPELETIEIDWDDGKRYKIPKAIEAGILKNKDYTTKTQEAAALRKQLESREVEITQKLEATEAELDARAELRSVSAQLAEYAKLKAEDWQYLLQQDPLGTQQAKLQMDMLKERKAELEGTLSKATTERTEKAQQALAKRVQDTLSEAPKIIPGWTSETADKTISELVSFATSEAGIPEQVLKENWSPQLLKLLHRAHLGHNLLTKQTAAPKLPTSQPKPLETVNGTKSAPTSGDLASADMEAYRAMRQKGVGGKPAF